MLSASADAPGFSPKYARAKGVGRLRRRIENPGNQHCAGNAGGTRMKTRMSHIGGDMRRAGTLPNEEYLKRITAELRNVFAQPRNRVCDIRRPAGPAMRRRQPIRHRHADPSLLHRPLPDIVEERRSW
jgi:hypothetical protein